MAAGPVRVRGTIDATLAPGALTLVHAWIRGTDKNDRSEVVVTAHLDHPKWSANDNASGSAAQIEIARTLVSLIRQNKLAAPRRTVHFIWVPELFGTIPEPDVYAAGALDIWPPSGRGASHHWPPW